MQKRIAIGRGARDFGGTDAARSAGAILNHEGLTKLLPELRENHARRGIGAATRRPGHHHAHWAIGPVATLRLRGQRKEGCRQRRRQQRAAARIKLRHHKPFHAARRIRSEARSASISTAGWMLEEGTSGKTEASTTRKPCTPRTRNSESTTERESVPIRFVPHG